MLYLLDANVLIDADRDYYALSRVPEFWDWLAHRGAKQQAKIPVEKGDLPKWLKENRDVLLLHENVEEKLVAHVTESGYASDLRDDEVERIGRDPFLIAYALVDPEQRIVVTTEVSKPRKRRANRQVPDVCKNLGVVCRTPYQFFRALDFRTDWRR